MKTHRLGTDYGPARVVTVRGDRKLHWHAQRWKIEAFHQIRNSDYRDKDAKPRAAHRAASLVSIFCIVIWRIYSMSMMNRALPDVPATFALIEAEADLLNSLVVDKPNAVGPGNLIPLSEQDCGAPPIPRPCSWCSTRQFCHGARIDALHLHRAWLPYRDRAYG